MLGEFSFEYDGATIKGNVCMYAIKKASDKAGLSLNEFLGSVSDTKDPSLLVELLFFSVQAWYASKGEECPYHNPDIAWFWNENVNAEEFIGKLSESKFFGNELKESGKEKKQRAKA